MINLVPYLIGFGLLAALGSAARSIEHSILDGDVSLIWRLIIVGLLLGALFFSEWILDKEREYGSLTGLFFSMGFSLLRIILLVLALGWLLLSPLPESDTLLTVLLSIGTVLMLLYGFKVHTLYLPKPKPRAWLNYLAGFLYQAAVVFLATFYMTLMGFTESYSIWWTPAQGFALFLLTAIIFLPFEIRLVQDRAASVNTGKNLLGFIAFLLGINALLMFQIFQPLL